MSDGQACGRKIHPTGRPEDPLPVCLMHSRDRLKNDSLFWSEIKAILSGCSPDHRPTDRYDFAGFVFPRVDLSARLFDKKANFAGTTFLTTAMFRKAIFREGAVFSAATFEGEAVFDEVEFHGPTDFSGVSFDGALRLRGSNFSGPADFSWTCFRKEADFSSIAFSEFVHFFRSWFVGSAIFASTTFVKGVSFNVAAFLGTAYFVESKLGSYTGSVADFHNCRFEKPGKVIFSRINKRDCQGLRARFLNCSIESVQFEDVNWHRRGGRMVLQDELDVRGDEGASKEVPETRHELVAIAYRRLVNNFEKVRADDLAEDCYCGAMEMKRLDPRQPLFSRFVLTVYRFASQYGGSYQRAGMVLAGLLLAFTLLFPVVGLRAGYSSGPSPVTSEVLSLAPKGGVVTWSSAQNVGAVWRTFKAGFWTAIEVGTFQRNPTLEPATIEGRRLAIVEVVSMPSQLALFLLALRRRFKR